MDENTAGSSIDNSANNVTDTHKTHWPRELLILQFSKHFKEKFWDICFEIPKKSKVKRDRYKKLVSK